MFIDLLKNPVIIALIFSVTVYIYLKWNRDKEIKKINNKLAKLKKTDNLNSTTGNKLKAKLKNQHINLFIPVIVGVVIWFLAYGYCESTTKEPMESLISKANIDNPFSPQQLSTTPATDGAAQSFRLVGKGVNFPNAIDSDFPDVFIRTY